MSRSIAVKIASNCTPLKIQTPQVPPTMPRETAQNRNRRILSLVAPENFVGRSDALARIVSFASPYAESRALLLFAAPLAGTTELLRQAYDALFQQRGDASPIYFAWSRGDRTLTAAAHRFFQTFLVQMIAHRRGDPALIDAPPPLRDLIDLAAPSDFEWTERLITTYLRVRTEGDDSALIRLCFGVPQQAAMHGARNVVLLDDVHLAGHLKGEVNSGAGVAGLFAGGAAPFVFAGLRRRLIEVVYGTSHSRASLDTHTTLHLESLSDKDAHTLIERLAFSHHVSVTDETRDLIAQQFAGSPFYITTLINAAQRTGCSLESFLDCQRLYVDELMGGRINRRFGAMLEELAPSVSARRALARLLYDATTNVNSKAPVEAWRRSMNLERDEFRQLMHELHARELASFEQAFVEVGSSTVWRDYLRAYYRLHIAAEPRALVVAETLTDALKRAPQTMERHYRREAAVNLRDLLMRFNYQRVPSSLLHYESFSRMYKGADAEEIASSLEAETDLVRLPQMVHAASCASFQPLMQLVCDEGSCAIAHGFDAASYTDASEIVWLAAEIESNKEAGRAITEMWCDRLAQLAHTCGFKRTRLWLVAPAGFSTEACELLTEREAFNSSRQQVGYLEARLGRGAVAEREPPSPNEFEMVIPMGSDTELIAAHTVEQIARRLDFKPEAINQIKTALVEACINAAEHSLSPDRKIYQRFRLESDKLVVTVSSRGVALPPPTMQNNGDGKSLEKDAEEKERRGWGLRLIRTLMDEVEFERVDDGTRLRMTKYLHR